jgi:serine/threonine-protein kinase
MAAAPEKDNGYRMLSRALASLDGFSDGLREAARQSWARTEGSGEARVEIADTINMDILKGDFASAERGVQRFEALVERDPSSSSHSLPAVQLVGVQLETGRRADAARTARTYLDRRRAWTSQATRGASTILPDPVFFMLSVLHHAGKMGSAEYNRERDELLAEWSKDDLAARYAWYMAYAATAETRAEATDALAVLPQFPHLPAATSWTMVTAQVGTTYLLAGRTDDAAPLLESGAAACFALDQPILHTRAQYDLGLVREALGNKDGACAAYGVVLARWGKASPRSVTAEMARARMRAIGCVF